MPKLSDYLPPTRILLSHATTRQAVIDELLQVMGSAPEVTDARALRIAIRDRESVISTAIGLGLAVPHVRLASVTATVMGLALLHTPIASTDTPDKLPIRAVFMVASPADARRDYLQWLAHVYSTWRDEAWRNRLLAATDPEAAWQVLATVPAPGPTHA